MKNIVIFFDTTNKSGRPFEFLDYPFMEKVYFDFFDILLERGSKLFIVRGTENIISDNSFATGFEYLGKGNFTSISEKITADIVWDRSLPNSAYPLTDATNVDIINCKSFKLICENKWESYKAFKEFFPKTELVTDLNNLEKIVSNIQTSKFVFKPLTMFGGKGIKLFDKSQISTFEKYLKENPEYINNSLIQDFCDSSIGIPGIIDGTHDLRFVVANKKPFFCYLRYPTDPNEFRANYSLGGKMLPIDISTLPKEITTFVNQVVESVYKEFSNPFFSVDVFNTKSGVFLIEFNGASTGFPEPGPELEQFYTGLANRFIPKG